MSVLLREEAEGQVVAARGATTWSRPGAHFPILVKPHLPLVLAYKKIQLSFQQRVSV